MDKKRILFIFQNYSTFVKTDVDILSSEYSITKFPFPKTKGLISTAIALAKQFLFLLFKGWHFDAVYIWFADYYTLLPALFFKFTKKKSFIVIGGYDVCRIPKYNYGAFNSKLRGYFAIQSMKFADYNLTVSTHVDRKVKFIAPKSKRLMVHNCSVFSPIKEKIEQRSGFLTIAFIENKNTFFLKGIDTFIETARLFPEHEFTIIGVSSIMLPFIMPLVPTNMKIIEKVPHEYLHQYLSRAKFYCQFSKSESFGVSVVEAIQFNCIPIVTNIGGLPEIVGNPIFVIKPDILEIKSKITNLLITDLSQELQDLKNRVNSLFSIDIRKSKLTSLLNKQLINCL